MFFQIVTLLVPSDSNVSIMQDLYQASPKEDDEFSSMESGTKDKMGGKPGDSY